MTERGSVTVVMTMVTALLGMLLVATASVGGVHVTRTRAMAAADAAALAAAVATYPDTGRSSPEVEARRVAIANGAMLAWCDCGRDDSLEVRVVSVIVEIPIVVPIFGRMTVRAASTAEFDPRRWLDR